MKHFTHQEIDEHVHAHRRYVELQNRRLMMIGRTDSKQDLIVKYMEAQKAKLFLDKHGSLILKDDEMKQGLWSSIRSIFGI